MSGKREAALRRIAIVLSSLPAPMAAQLLGEIDADSKRVLCRTMTSLSDVDPMERKRALQAFFDSLKQPSSTQHTAAPSPDEIVLTSLGRPSLATHRAGRTDASRGTLPMPEAAHASPEPNTASHQALAFLGDVEDDTLVRLVVGEHPQTVALVLASIAPAQAARVLPRLEPRLRSEAMSRIGRLGEIPAEVVAELAQHLRARVATTLPQVSANGKRRLDAILAAMPGDGTLAREPSADVGSAPRSDAPHSDSYGSTERGRGELRIAPETLPHRPQRRATHTPETLSWSTDDIHQHLLSLTPSELREALASVETRDALLGLCGVPPEVANAVLATLPRAQARQIRSQLNSIGSLQLREIDEAKQRIAQASLASALPLPSPPHALPLAA